MSTSSRGALPRNLHKKVKGTNIVVEKASTDGVMDPCLRLLHRIAADDPTELRWLSHTMRPEKNLIHPSESFRQGIKTLHPATVFSTFDLKKSKLRRLAKQHTDKARALKRRTEEVAPTAAFRASINPHKTPRVGGHATEEEIRFLSRGQKTKKTLSDSSRAGAEQPAGYFKKWKKMKVAKIGKGL